jgi:hypothetical protein
MTFSDAPNEKGPAGFCLAGPLGVLGRNDYAQESKAPAGLVLVAFFVVVRIMGREM